MRFRIATATLTAMLIAFVFNVTAVTAQEGAKFAGTAKMPDPYKFASNFSNDKLAVTVLFKNFATSLDPGKDKPTTANILTSLHLPLSTNPHGTVARNTLRGFAQLDPGVYATLVIQAGGTTRTVNLNTIPKDDTTENGGDFVYAFDTTLAKDITNYDVSFTILLQRSTSDPETGANIQIDSFDSELKPFATAQSCCEIIYVNDCYCPPRRWVWRRR